MNFSGIEISFLFCSLFVIIYSVMILIFIFSWIKMKEFIPQARNSNTSISIIVPARNEERTIGNCVRSLIHQDIGPSRIELIVVNDHSEDRTAEYMLQFAQEFKNIKYFDLSDNENGKKAAIKKAIEVAANELVMMTDADCTVEKQMANTVISFFETHDADLILLPVLVKADDSFFSKIQALESLSLLAVTGASANINAPLLSNGAGIVYTKTTFKEMKGFEGNLHFPGGDDMMILEKVRNSGKVIHFLLSGKALVETEPVRGIKAFFDQRVRWASKTKHYSDKRSKSIALLVFITSLSLVFTGVSGLFLLDKCLLTWAISLVIFKAIFDFLFLFLAAKPFKRIGLMAWFLPIQLFYPFYVVIVGVFSLLSSYSWKGRVYKN